VGSLRARMRWVTSWSVRCVVMRMGMWRKTQWRRLREHSS